MASFISFIVLLLRSFPSIEKFSARVIEEWHTYDKRKRESDAQIRKDDKIRRINARVYADLDGVPDATDQTRERGTIDGPKGFRDGKESGTGVGLGGPDNNS